MDLRLRILNAQGLLVTDVGQLTVSTPLGTGVPAPNGSGGWTATLPAPFVITRAQSGELSIVCTGPDYGRLSLTPGVVDVVPVLGRVKRVDIRSDPAVVAGVMGPQLVPQAAR